MMMLIPMMIWVGFGHWRTRRKLLCQLSSEGGLTCGNCRSDVCSRAGGVPLHDEGLETVCSRLEKSVRRAGETGGL